MDILIYIWRLPETLVSGGCPPIVLTTPPIVFHRFGSVFHLPRARGIVFHPAPQTPPARLDFYLSLVRPGPITA